MYSMHGIWLPSTRTCTTLVPRRSSAFSVSRNCYGESFNSSDYSECNHSDKKGEQLSSVTLHPAKTASSFQGFNELTMELMNIPIPPAKMASKDDDQLLPLLSSMVIEGLPPLQQSKYVHEAEKLLQQFVERYQNIISFDSYCSVGLSFTSYIHCGVISVDRLVVLSIVHALGFLLDDLFIDNQNEFLLDQYGVDRSALGSPEKTLQSLVHLVAVFGQQRPAHHSATLIETIMAEMGQEMLQLSNPEWFNTFVESVIEEHQRNVANIVAGHNLCFQDLEAYTIMRAGNVGGKSIQLLMEFANNAYIPNAMRSDPFMQKVTAATSVHLGFVNDIYSYPKESSQEENPLNLITVLMECEGKSVFQAVHAAMGLVNTYAHIILDLESEASNSVLQNHLRHIEELIVGNAYYGCMDKRYRQPDSIFPELRDTTCSWKLSP